MPSSSFHFVQAKREAKRAGDAREAEAQRRTRASKKKNKQNKQKKHTYTPAGGGVVRILVKLLALSGS